MVSESVQEYLEAIYKLTGEEEQTVALSTLAQQLHISPVSANEMVRKLVEQGLVLYVPYKGVSLTAEGRARALRVIRRHRLWERLLTDVLGLPWDQVHAEACRLEHATSLLLEERMAEYLDQPRTCPHGHPIPTDAGEMTNQIGRPLAELEPGQEGVVVCVRDENPELLQYLDSLGLRPQSTVLVEDVAPFRGPLTVQVGEAHHVLGREVAALVIVRLL